MSFDSLLRPPDFGNTFKFVPNTRTHRTMDNDLRVLQGNAPVWQGWFSRFSALSLAQITAFIAYVNANFGRQIELIDFEKRNWVGIIVSKSIPILHGKGQCRYQTEFEFEGFPYFAKSNSSVAVANGTVTFTVPAGSYLNTIGQILTASSGLNSLSGKVLSATSNTIVIAVDTTTGSGTHTDWYLA